MSNDLKELKIKILEEDQIPKILTALGCNGVERKNNRYEASLPTRFNSNNRRSVQVKLNENLNSSIRSLAVNGIDIYGLVSYILNDKKDRESQQQDLPFSKQWICQELGYHEFLNNHYEEPKYKNALGWLTNFKRQHRTSSRELPEYYNHIYDNEILDNYLIMPHKNLYVKDDIHPTTQQFFELGFDFRSRRIIFPIYDRDGKIVSIKGRTLDDLNEDNKYFYLLNFNKMIELYNWHHALPHILSSKQVIIYESEKSCWKSWQYGYKNCVGLMGSDISDWQINMIKELGLDIEIVLSMDKDKSEESVDFLAKKFGRLRNVYKLFDTQDLFSGKDSPLDLGKEVFEQLYNNDKHKINLLT